MGWLDRLRAGLGRTAQGLAALLARPLDEAGARELRERLVAADLGVETADEVVVAVREAWRREPALREGGAAEAAAAVLERLLAAPTWAPDWSAQPQVILLLGVNGAGKTTTAAKLAHRLAGEGHPALLGACDTFRAAAGPVEFGHH